jgi:hypothetical protein
MDLLPHVPTERKPMKTPCLIVACAVALCANAFAAGDHAHVDDHTPKHGGIVVGTRSADFELVAKPDLVRLYVSDHGKAVDLAKAAAKLTLLSGSEKQEVELRPAGDKLEASGSFKVGPGTKAVVVVTGLGKAASTARFTLK